jgi:hypothetical protein
MDRDNCSVNNAHKHTFNDQHACLDGYPQPDLHFFANIYHHTRSEPDPLAERYLLAILDTQPDRDSHLDPPAFPDSYGDIHFDANLDYYPDGYTLAGPYANKHKIRVAGIISI